MLNEPNLLDPRRQGESASSAAWYHFPLTLLLAAACGVILRGLKLPPPVSPLLMTALVCLWWMVTSYIYLRLSLRKAFSGLAFVHWLLSTPRLYLRCLAALVIGGFFSALLGNALPLFMALGLAGRHTSPASGKCRGCVTARN